ncbi:uncharacterized protein TNCT_493951 [Trichonephila clavata]|uniref:Sodium-dependent multivitamin transporter n=1 Tax=Trichonephila clavata TaxID=2740835 RepID=A0A8X6K7K1_TRICU|nr:uncharacterized protein TNCT_493951 [Trichonephila clavata]
MFGALCMGLSFLVASLGHLVKMSIIIIGMVGGPNLAVFFLAACTTKANEEGAILGILISLTLAAYLSFSPNSKLYSFLPLTNECPLPETAESTSTTFSSLPYSTVNSYSNTTLSSASRQETKDDSFRLSYMWISTLAFVTCFIVGYLGSVMISRIRGNSNEVPAIYLSPIRTRFFKKQTNVEEQKCKYKAIKVEINGRSNEIDLNVTVSNTIYSVY